MVLGIFAGSDFGRSSAWAWSLAGVRGRTDHLPLAPFLGARAVFAILAGGPVRQPWLS